jgi:hypothetical protein
VLSAGEAKEIALRQGFSPWIERVHHQWRLPWTHIDIDPGYVVIIALDDGRSFEVRVLKVDIGATFAMAGQTGTYDLSGGALFAAGDRLAVTAPATADTTLADVALGLKGVRAS